MYTEEDKIKIADLLRDCRQFMNPVKLKKIPGNYAQLKEAALLHELAREVHKLKALFSPDASNEALLKQSFLTLCAQREEQNQGTCMSYTALPEGMCNCLYLEIATILFKPRHFGELLAILLPGMKASLTAELVFSQTYTSSAVSRKAEENLDVALKEEPFAAFANYPAQSTMLTQVVTGDGLVFNLESIANLPLRLREQFHRLIASYPALNNKIYKQNDDLQQLLFDLELVNKHGATPDEMLQHFSNELLRAGTRFTGNVIAASSVTGPCSQFRHYLDQLPSEWEEKLAAMRSADGADSLAKVLEHLANANCVEEAAVRVRKIRENPANKELLMSHPGITKEQEHKIRQKYEKAIEVTGFENTNKLPENLKQELIRNIRIKSAYDYIDLLLNLPAEEYLTFLTHASITCTPPLPAELAAATKMLNTEQTTAFFDAVFAQKDKFGGTRAIVFFAAGCNISAKVLQAVPENERRSLSKEIDEHDKSLLAWAAQNSNHEIWKSLWDTLSVDERLSLLNKRDLFNNTTMKYAAGNNNPEILRIILDFLPDQTRLMYLRMKDPGTDSPLDIAIINSNPVTLQIIRQYLPVEDYLKLIADEGPSLLAKVIDANHQENLMSLIVYLKQHNMVRILNNKSAGNINILHRAASCRNPEIARILLAALTEQEIKALLSEKNEDRSTPLEVAGGNPDVFTIMMGFLTENERFAALSSGVLIRQLAKVKTPENWDRIWRLFEDKNKYASLFLADGAELCPLHEAARNTNTKIWHDLWGALSSKQRADFVKRNVNKSGFDGFKDQKTLLQYLAAECHFEAWSDVWEVHPENERAAIMGGKHEYGETILHYAAQNHDLEVTSAILRFLSANNLLTELNIKRDDGATPFHKAIYFNNSPFLFALLEMIPAKNRLTMLRQRNVDGNSVLHTNLVGFWQVFLQLLPADDRLAALKEENKKGESPLQFAIICDSPVIPVMLSPLSQHERMLILSEKDSQNYTPLYKALECNGEVWSSIWNYMPEQLRLSEIKNKKDGGTLLHLAVRKNKAKLVAAILRLLPARDRLAALTAKDADEMTPLHMAACLNDNEILLLMLEYLPLQDYLTAIRTKTKYGDSVLHSARFSVENFYTLLQALPEGDRLTALEDKNHAGLNPLNAAISTKKEGILIKIHELLPLTEILVLLKSKDNHGNNALHLASAMAEMPGIFLRILSMLPEDESLLIVNEKNEVGNTPLHPIAREWNVTAWSELWKVFTDKAKLSSLFAEQKNEANVCPLHCVVLNNNPAMWNNLWDALTANQKSAFAKKEIEKGKRLLHVAAQSAYSDVWKKIWTYHSGQERLTAVAEKSVDGLNILHWATHNHTGKSNLELTRDIVHFLSENKLTFMLTEKSNNGNTPLHSAVINVNPAVLSVLLESIPPQDRLTILKQQNAEGNSPIHMAAGLSYAGCWQVIIRSLPDHDRLGALMVKNKSGHTFFHLLVKNINSKLSSGSFASCWSELSEAEQLRALNDKDSLGNNLLHYAAKCPSTEIWSTILVSLPLQFCRQALRMLNRSGNTPLHTAALHNNLVTMVHHLPTEERMAFLKEMNTQGDTSLHVAARNNNLTRLLQFLSQSDRKEVLKAKNHAGSTVLHCLTEMKNEIIIGNILILEILSKEERLLLITEKNKFGHTPMALT